MASFPAKKKRDDLQLVVWCFIREQYEDKLNRINVPIALKYLITKFSKNVIGSNMMTIKEDINFIQLLLLKISNIKRFKLLYRGSEHKYSAKKFHELCDGHGPTICFIKSNFVNIFGGYSSIKWSSDGGWHKDENAFLFLIRSDNELQQQQCPVILDCVEPQYAVRHLSAYGPSFGSEHDICIRDKCNNTSMRGWRDSNYVDQVSYINKVIIEPLCGGNLRDTVEKTTYLFNVLEYEVFEMQ